MVKLTLEAELVVGIVTSLEGLQRISDLSALGTVLSRHSSWRVGCVVGQ